MLFKERHCMSVVWRMRDNTHDSFLKSGQSFKINVFSRGQNPTANIVFLVTLFRYAWEHNNIYIYGCLGSDAARRKNKSADQWKTTAF